MNTSLPPQKQHAYVYELALYHLKCTVNPSKTHHATHSFCLAFSKRKPHD